MARCECYDYPVSWTFYRSHCITEHGFDPGSNVPEDSYNEQQPIPEVPADIQYQLDRTTARLNYLTNKINDHLDKSKKKEVYQYK